MAVYLGRARNARARWASQGPPPIRRATCDHRLPHLVGSAGSGQQLAGVLEARFHVDRGGEAEVADLDEARGGRARRPASRNYCSTHSCGSRRGAGLLADYGDPPVAGRLYKILGDIAIEEERQMLRSRASARRNCSAAVESVLAPTPPHHTRKPQYFRGAEGDRTLGLQSAILALSQLSYSPVPSARARRAFY
jgi:hypothetical protein